VLISVVVVVIFRHSSFSGFQMRPRSNIVAGRTYEIVSKEETGIVVLLFRRLSLKELFKLDDFLTATHDKQNWPPIGRCVRRAIVLHRDWVELKMSKKSCRRESLDYAKIFEGIAGKTGKKRTNRR